MRWALRLVTVTVAALAFATATATSAPNLAPPLFQHETTCTFGSGFGDVTMWLSAHMGSGDTFWLERDGVYLGHYVIGVVRTVDTASAAVPTTGWSDPISIGVKTGLASTAIECRGYFQDGATYHWVDSTDYLIR